MVEQDEVLIRRLAQGDIRALDELYTRYARPVYSLALRILADSADAEEVVQDVFERVWRHAPSYDASRGKFGTWLMSMAHHISIDRVRKQQRRPQASNDESNQLALERAVDREDVSETGLRNVEAQQVRRALRSLPEQQRTAIELAYFGGLSHIEIASALGDPLGTVKARIRRGMERLRSALSGIAIENDM